MQKRTWFSLMLISLLVAAMASLSFGQTVTVESKGDLPRCVSQSVNVDVDLPESVSAVEVVLEITEGANGEFITITGFDWNVALGELDDRVVDLSQADGVGPSDMIRMLAMRLQPTDECLPAGMHNLGAITFTVNYNCGGDTVRFDNAVFAYPNPTCMITTQVIDCATGDLMAAAVTPGKVHIKNFDPTVEAIDDATIHWGDLFTYQVVADDQDLPNGCEALRYSVTGPDDMTIGPSGYISWLSDGDDVCEQPIQVTVTDTCGATASTSFTICVQNTPPVAICPNDTTIGWGDDLVTTVTATDDDSGPYGPYYSLVSFTGPGTPTVNAITGEVTWVTEYDSLYTGQFEICVAVTDSAETCDPCSPENADTCCFWVEVVPFQITIEKRGLEYGGGEPAGGVGVFQGQETSVDVNMLNSNYVNYPMGGFNFLFAYDAAALSFMYADEGQFIMDCGWEYFTYRYGPDGNCGMGCPTGLLRIVAIAETNNGPGNNPLCYTNGPGPPPVSDQLAVLHFLVSNDRTLECQFVPIRFFWVECTDNVISSQYGDTLFISQFVIDVYSDTISDLNAEMPTYQGAPDDCDVSDKGWPVRLVHFVNGGVQIACAEEIDRRGDVNLNGTAYEVADAVMYTNYFIKGLDAFDLGLDPLVYPDQIEASIAASDCNADGIPLSVADLVYLIRVVVGDAQAYPKEVIAAKVNYTHDAGAVKVLDDTEIGAAYLVLTGNVTPELAADNMEMMYRFDGTNTRVIVFSIEGEGFTGDILSGADGDILTIEMATINGLPLAATNVPAHYNLSQNYPNPFNPTTTIEFAMPAAGKYCLTIYNIQGQVVDVISGVADAPGVISTEWDASVFASGVYLYRLEANEFTSVKKMVLLK